MTGRRGLFGTHPLGGRMKVSGATSPEALAAPPPIGAAPALASPSAKVAAKLRRSSIGLLRHSAADAVARADDGREGPAPARVRSMVAAISSSSEGVRDSVAASIQPST